MHSLIDENITIQLFNQSQQFSHFPLQLLNNNHEKIFSRTLKIQQQQQQQQKTFSHLQIIEICSLCFILIENITIYLFTYRKQLSKQTSLNTK